MATNTQRINLPDGEWADIRDPKKVPERLRRPVREAALNLQQSLPEDQRRTTVKVSDEPEHVAEEDVQSAFGAPPVEALLEQTAEEDKKKAEYLPTAEQQELADVYNEVLIASVVVAWSYEEAVTIEAIRDLPGDAYDELLSEIRKLGAEGADESLASDPSAP